MAHMRKNESKQRDQLLNRRTMIAGTVATGVAVVGQPVSAAQSTPEASPVSGALLDPGNVMMLSANLCAGVILNEDHVDILISYLAAEDDIEPTLEELMAIPWFTPEDLAAASPEAQRIARNILQYWFLGQYDGELVENRSALYLDLASWQSLPYATQQGACKGENYWAKEIEL